MIFCYEGYTGKERDLESIADDGGTYAGLDYLGARTYAPSFARFVQVDPLLEKHASNKLKTLLEK